MYGTVARIQAKAGMLDDMMTLQDEFEGNRPPGFVATYVYQTDDDPNELYLVVLFESHEAYTANADSPEQHERFMRWREMMAADPEWHDGEIIHASSA